MAEKIAEAPETVEEVDLPRRMLNINQVLELVPVSRTTLFKMEGQGTFPASTYISPNRRCWYADDVARWQKTLPANSRMGRKAVHPGKENE